MQALAPGFADPVTSSQRVFRGVMDAMARPGTIVQLVLDLAPPEPLSRGAAAVALTLLDYEAPVWLDPQLAKNGHVNEWLRFHTGAPLVEEPREAAFAFLQDSRALPAFEQFAQGTQEYPDRSATLVIEVDTLGTGSSFLLKGPGISDAQPFALGPVPDDFIARMAANRALFPRGIDLIFVTDDAVAALPRSTRVLPEA